MSRNSTATQAQQSTQQVQQPQQVQQGQVQAQQQIVSWISLNACSGPTRGAKNSDRGAHFDRREQALKVY